MAGSVVMSCVDKQTVVSYFVAPTLFRARIKQTDIPM
jgi:hypothetical protein